MDGSERVLNLNPSAARLFGVQIAQVRGRSLVEVVRNPDLLRFVTRTLAAPEPLEGERMPPHKPEARENRSIRSIDASKPARSPTGYVAMGAWMCPRRGREPKGLGPPS